MLAKLNSRLPPAKTTHESPFILKLIRKCQRYGISYDMMIRLNFNDLLALVVEYEIDTLEDYFRQREKQRNNERGVEVVDATNEDILRETNYGRKG